MGICGPLYALVSFEPASRQAHQVVVMFESAAAADRFVVEHCLDDYVVAPVAFCVDPPFSTRKDRP